MTRSSSLLRELWLGFCRPTWLGLLVALLVPTCTFVFLARWLTPQVFVERAGYFASDPLDTTLWVSTRLERLLQNYDLTQGPLLAVAGSSGLAESLSTADDLAGAAGAAAGVSVRVADLSCFGQSVLDTLALMDALPERFDGVVVANVSPRLIGRGWRYEKPFGNRMAVRSPFVEDLVRHDGVDMAPLSGTYLFDHRWFFLPRLWGALGHAFSGPVVERRHPYRDADEWIAPRLFTEQLNRVRLSYEDYEENFAFTMEMFRRVKERLELRGRVRIVLLEAPVKPGVVAEAYGEEAFAEHHTRMARFADENGFVYWDLNAAAGLTDDDFYDYTHLWTAAAQERYTELLGQRAGELLGEVLQ